MSRRGYASRSRAGTDANGMTAEDRAAARTYRTQTYGGGLVSKHYRQDMNEITNAGPSPKATAQGNEK